MVPIYEQGAGKGIGHSYESFSERFISLCEEDMKTNRAKAFAFIFRDFEDQNLNKILKDEGVFIKLDRISGKDISVFYLHESARGRAEAFNGKFLDIVGFPRPESMPCVVFFKLKNGVISAQEIVYLDSSNLKTAFHELFQLIQAYINNFPEKRKSEKFNALKLVTGAGKTIAVEAFKAALQGLFKGLWGG